MIPGLKPIDIGLPAKFTKWRPGQLTALGRSLSPTAKRFQAHSMPVGEGKSLYYVAQALLESTRACILTSTRGLQDQLMKDFASIGMVDMRGRGNYPCVHKDCHTCEEGQHYKCAPADC